VFELTVGMSEKFKYLKDMKAAGKKGWSGIQKLSVPLLRRRKNISADSSAKGRSNQNVISWPEKIERL